MKQNRLPLDYSKYKRRYTVDFETSTDKWNVDKARIWLYDVCNIDYLQHRTGTTMEGFINDICADAKFGYESVLIGFHNLAYDGIYLLSYLLENGFVCVPNEKPNEKEIYCIINEMGIHYAYIINFGRIGCSYKEFKVMVVDTFKTIHLSVSKIAYAYDLPILKGDIDYDMYREIGYTPTQTEIDYIHNDTEIVARALQENFKLGLHKVTQPANAFSFYRKLIGAQNFDTYFPKDAYLDFTRKAYFGGMCYANPKYVGKEIHNVWSFDINSMYPSAMLHYLLPIGEGLKGDGNALDYINNSKHFDVNTNCVYVQRIRCAYELKQGKIPSLFKNRMARFNELHSTSSDFRVLELTLTGQDIELLFENYHVYELEYVDYVIYDAVKGYELNDHEFNTLSYKEIVELDGKGSLFYEYIKFWRQVKENSTGAKRENAKFMQNMLYGNFGKNIDGKVKVPYINEDGLITYTVADTGHKRTEYVPMACFITSWCRYHLIKDILANIDDFLYCDTDSLYLIKHSDKLPKLRIHDRIYGAYKMEHIIERIKVLGSKRYIYYGREPNETEIKLHVKCCGADDNIKRQITFENFENDLELDGKRQVKTVRGGKHISTTKYKIKG